MNSNDTNGQTVGLNINNTALLQSLRFAFTNHDTVVQELLQNARRAGATRIKVYYLPEQRHLRIEDDGSGIQDHQLLLSIGNSGWSQELVEEEGPYGIGFLSAIYAAEQICVASNGKELVASTSDLLGGSAMRIKEVEKHPGTIVVLNGFTWEFPDIHIREFAKGFPVPLEFNGESLESPDAIGAEFVATVAGDIRFSDRPGNRARVYLQGFNINGTTGHLDEGYDVVHLDPKKFKGRLPDRSAVIDHKNMLSVLSQARLEYWQQKLSAERTSMPMEAFLERRAVDAMFVFGPSYFDDIDLLPADWLASYSDGATSLDEAQGAKPPAMVSKEDVQSGRIQIIADPWYDLVDDEQDPARFHLAAMSGAYRLVNAGARLQDSHWVIKLAQHKREDTIEVALGEVLLTETCKTLPRMRGTWVDVVVAKSARMTSSGGNQVDAPAGSVLAYRHPDDGMKLLLVCNADGSVPYVSARGMGTVIEYCEDDDLLWEDADQDSDEIDRFVRERLAKTVDERALMVARQLISREMSFLAGQQLTLTIGKDGLIEKADIQATPA